MLAYNPSRTVRGGDCSYTEQLKGKASNSDRVFSLEGGCRADNNTQVVPHWPAIMNHNGTLSLHGMR